MNEKPPNSASLFLNEDVDKPPLPDRGDLRRRLHRAMERRASSVKERISSFSRESLTRFLKRNLFVLFTVAAVALGEQRGKPFGSCLDASLFRRSIESSLTNLFYFVCVHLKSCLCRCNPGLCSAPLQPVPEGDQVLCLSWGAPDENAEDAGAASHCLQSGHRLAFTTFFVL